MAAASKIRTLRWCLIGFAILIVANVLIAAIHTGTQAGQTYRWLCRDSGVELSYNPSVFGSARLSHGRTDLLRGHCWELIEPRAPSPVLPWNWLARLLAPATPSADAVAQQAIPDNS